MYQSFTKHLNLTVILLKMYVIDTKCQVLKSKFFPICVVLIVMFVAAVGFLISTEDKMVIRVFTI